jgi:3-methyladenine DNA glycosylase Tag
MVCVLKLVCYKKKKKCVDNVDQEKIFSIMCLELIQNYYKD